MFSGEVMNTDLSIVDTSSTNAHIEFRHEMGIIHEIVAECEKEIVFMNQVHDFVYGDERHNMINRLLRLNHRPDDERTRLNRPWLDKVDLEWVKQNIWAEYWKKITDMTNVLLIMPASRRDEWREQFIEGKQETTKTDRTGYQMRVKEFVGVPEFKAETVIPTMLNLLNDRHKYLSERVYGLFKALSPAHKTNKTNGFSERLIIANCISEFWRDSVSVNYLKEDYIDDLRVMLHFFAHKEFITINRTTEMLSAAYRANDCQTGDWMNVDGNLMRVKMFKNGNVHFEIHPDVAWKLNEVLAYSMPAAIPAPYRTAPKTRASKEFGLIQKTISEPVRTALRDGRFSKDKGVWYFFDSKLQKTQSDELERTLTFIGGVQENKHWRFPYEVGHTLNTIVATGLIPDAKSHQFYPTPRIIAEYVARAIELQPGETLLEPEAGRGDLLAYVETRQEDITCIEVAPLFAEILRGKGYVNTVCCDFMKWSDDNAGYMFDKIVMNPPYSLGRHKEHTMAALEHLKVGGRLVAVLPGDAPVLNWLTLDNYVYAKGKSFTDEFEDTGITVSVYVFKRVK
ncbi:DNA modification methylase [Salmonella enterica subsp. enterica serovar Give]|nr:DNA modification methylase [Salmonella enterica subsp. enterica serovar Give]